MVEKSENKDLSSEEEQVMGEEPGNEAKVYSRDVYAKKSFWDDRFTE